MTATVKKGTSVDGPTQTAVDFDNRWEAHPKVAKAIRVSIVLFPLALTFALTWAAGRHIPPERVGLNRWVWWVILMIASWVVLRGLNHIARRATPIAAMLQVSMIFPDEAPSRARTALRSTNGKRILRELREAEAAGRTAPHVPSSDFLAGMLRALAEHEPLTRGHSERVRAYTDLIAEELGLPEEDQHKLRWAALLHDIGKLEVPAEILNSKDRPSDEEWEILKTHPSHGGRLMEPMRDWLGEWALAAEEHHLRWDGRGYPTSLAGTEISLAGRIVAVADAYDVMTSIRSYKKGMSPESARKELARCSGAQFDPMVVRAFLAVGVGRLRAVLGPFGSIVGLLETFRLPFNPGVIATAGSAAAGAAAATVGAVAGLPPVEPTPEAIPFVEPIAIDQAEMTVEVPEDTIGEIVIEGTGGQGRIRITIGPAQDGAVSQEVETIYADTADTWSFDLDYAPTADYNGADSFNFTICDENDDCATGTARIAVTPVNDRPIAADDRVVPATLDGVVVNPLENDDDPDGDPLTIRYLSAAENGTATVVGSSVRYVPDPDFRGVERLEYDIADTEGAIATGTIVIDLRNFNSPPSTAADTATVAEDDTIVIDVLANDTDTEDGRPRGPLTIVTRPANGNVIVNADRTLSYRPDRNHHGTDTFTYRVADRDGKTSPVSRVDITITPVNDPPTITAGGAVSVAEDSGPVAVAWATGIGAGPGDTGQTVSITTSADDPTLFAVPPALGPDGVLLFTPAPDAVGSTAVSVVLSDDGGTSRGDRDTTGPVTFTISITDVNDPPGFTPGGDITVLEDAGTTSIPWATAISAGPPSEATQTLLFSVTNDNPALFATPPTIAPDGTLTFAPAPHQHGTATVTVSLSDDGGTAGGGSDLAPTAAFTLAVLPVNDPPRYIPGPVVTVPEDSGPYSATWATSIQPGPVDEAAQSLVVTVTNDNQTLFTTAPTIAPDGTLTFTPAPDATGTATVSVTMTDNAGTANGGNDTSTTATFPITLSAVNDPPTFVAGGDIAVLEDSGLHTSTWATALSPGPPDESGQALAFTVTNDNPALFTTPPTIAPDGTLTFTPAPDATGATTVSVVLSDDGGTVDGGEDIAAAVLFTLTVDPVNDAPAFTAGEDPVVVAEDSGPITMGWATGISPGPADEATQSVLFTVAHTNPGLFSTAPAISPDGTLTFTPAPASSGTATVTVTLSDTGGTADGGADTSGSESFDIVVAAVNDPPSFQSGAPVTVLEDSGAYIGPWATAITAGPADEAAQILTFTVSNDDNTLFTAQPAVDAASGDLTFTPAPDATGTATVTVVLTDDGGTANGGDDTSAPATFTITLTAVNDEPAFAGPDITVDEDSGPHSALWPTILSAGPPDESAQTFSWTVGNDNPTLFAAAPAIAPDGTLTFTPAPDANGFATITVDLTDDGGTADGGDDTAPSQTFTLTVDPVNDAPAFDAGPDQTASSEAGPVTVAGWATNIGAGPPDESGQTLTFTVTNDDNALFTTQPAIAADGTLTYTPDPTTTGSATVTVTLGDDGGTANGGDDTTAPQVFTISIELPQVVISELRSRGPGGVQDDFVEIYNAGPNPIDIGGWMLQLEDLVASETVTVPGSVVLPPGGYYLFAHASFSGGPADLNFANDWGSNGSVALESPALGIVDEVALRPTAPYGEGANLPPMSVVIDQSYERLPAGFSGNCSDTDDNASDFVHNFGFSNPDTFGTVRPCSPLAPTATSVVISEFRPLGPGGGSDEFVEIYNPTGAPVDMSGWKLHVTSALDFDYYVFPAATTLAPGQHYLVTHPAASITGDDTWSGLFYGTAFGDVVLRDSADNNIDILGYGGGPILWEGVPSPSYPGSFTQTSYQRRNGGCSDVGTNVFDFVVAPADPQDSTVITGC